MAKFIKIKKECLEDGSYYMSYWQGKPSWNELVKVFKKKFAKDIACWEDPEDGLAFTMQEKIFCYLDEDHYNLAIENHAGPDNKEDTWIVPFCDSI